VAGRLSVRQLDGICFWGNGDDSSMKVFWIEFGSHGKIRGFSLNWPSLERYKSQPTANPQQIIACIRAHKIIVIPNADEESILRGQALANAKKFTITKITPHYGEGFMEKRQRIMNHRNVFLPLRNWKQLPISEQQCLRPTLFSNSFVGSKQLIESQ